MTCYLFEFSNHVSIFVPPLVKIALYLVVVYFSMLLDKTDNLFLFLHTSKYSALIGIFNYFYPLRPTILIWFGYNFNAIFMTKTSHRISGFTWIFGCSCLASWMICMTQWFIFKSHSFFFSAQKYIPGFKSLFF